jgi:hypothetical protein
MVSKVPSIHALAAESFGAFDFFKPFFRPASFKPVGNALRNLVNLLR